MKIAKQTQEYNAIIGRSKRKLPLTASQNDSAKHSYLKKEIKMYIPIGHQTAASFHQNGFHDWVRIKKGTIKLPFKNNLKRFENFIQGYLLYFEQNDNATGNENRTIYFDWGKTNDEFDLIIYMKPLYVRNYHDYKDPMSPFPFPYPPSVTVDPPPVKKAPPPGA